MKTQRTPVAQSQIEAMAILHAKALDEGRIADAAIIVTEALTIGVEKQMLRLSRTIRGVGK